jgi:predicted permease
MVNDIRVAVHALVSNARITLLVTALLAVSIGVSCIIFNVYNRILLRPLPVVNPSELVRVISRNSQLGTRGDFPFWLYRDIHAKSTTLKSVFAITELTVPLTAPGPTEGIHIELPTSGFFEDLTVHALYGRTLLTEDEDEKSTDLPAVVSYRFWRSQLNEDPQVIGKNIGLRRYRFAVVGIMPESFCGIKIDICPDVWVPLRSYRLLEADSSALLEETAGFEIVGRLKPGVTSAQAEAECFSIWKNTAAQLAPSEMADEIRQGLQPRLETVSRGISILRERFGRPIQLLLASACVLVLLAGANISGILLLKSAVRKKEIALKLAMGATRGRLIQQTLIESAFITLTGCVSGLAVTWMVDPVLVAVLPPIRNLDTSVLPITLPLTVDWQVFSFSAAISIFATIVSGCFPAIAISQVNLAGILRDNQEQHRWRSQRVLMIFQLGLCTFLMLIGALFSRTLYKLRATNPGFDTNRVVTFTVNPRLAHYTPQHLSSLRKSLMEQVRTISGVSDVALASRAVMRGVGSKTTIAQAGKTIRPEAFLNVSSNEISGNYFSTMGIRLLRGRALSPNDTPEQKPLSVVINESFARKFFPYADAIGKLFGTPQSGSAMAEGVAQPMYEIVGVVSDSKYRSIRESVSPTFYSPFRSPEGTFQLLVRTNDTPNFVIPSVRGLLKNLDPSLPFAEIHSLSEEVDASFGTERLIFILVTTFAFVASLLAGIGLYGFMAYAVLQRQKDIAIRVALGATRITIVLMLLNDVLLMLAIGVALSVVGIIWLRPVLQPLLYELSISDPISFAMVGGYLIAVCACATIVPVIRAVRINPVLGLAQS